MAKKTGSFNDCVRNALTLGYDVWRGPGLGALAQRADF